MAQDIAPNAPRGEHPFVGRDGRLTETGLMMLEQLWRQVAAGFVVVPCTLTGTNIITLTPVLHREGARTYANGMIFPGVAAASSTGAVTAKVADAEGNALATIKVYIANGGTQAGLNDILINRQYLFAYESSLDGGAGGFVVR